MTSEEQKREINKKILLVTEEFLCVGGTIEDISNKTGISSSSVQRYLNDKRIIDLLGQDVYEEIQNKLKNNKYNGEQLGGEMFANNNISLKDSTGKFTGSRGK